MLGLLASGFKLAFNAQKEKKQNNFALFAMHKIEACTSG